MLFGREINKAAKVQNVNHDSGEVKSLSFEKFFIKYVKNKLNAYVRPKGDIFLFLVAYKLSELNKSDAINHKKLYAKIKQFLSTSNDYQFVYNQITIQKILI